jgi:hypothetical protein
MFDLSEDEISVLKFLENNATQLYEISNTGLKMLPRLISLNLVIVVSDIIYCLSPLGSDVLKELRMNIDEKEKKEKEEKDTLQTDVVKSYDSLLKIAAQLIKLDAIAVVDKNLELHDKLLDQYNRFTVWCLRKNLKPVMNSSEIFKETCKATELIKTVEQIISEDKLQTDVVELDHSLAEILAQFLKQIDIASADGNRKLYHKLNNQWMRISSTKSELGTRFKSQIYSPERSKKILENARKTFELSNTDNDTIEQRRVVANLSIIENDQPSKIIIKGNCQVKVDEVFQKVEFSIEETGLRLLNPWIDLFVPYSRIKSQNYNHDCGILILEGLIKDKQFANKIELFIPFGDDLNKLVIFIESSPKIFDYFSDTAVVSPVLVTRKSSDMIHYEYPAIFIYEYDEYKIFIDSTFSFEQTFRINEDSFHFDSGTGTLLIMKAAIPYQLKFEEECELVRKIELDSFKLYQDLGRISGTYRNTTEVALPFDLLCDKSSYHFLFRESLNVTDKIPFNRSFTTQIEDRLFIFSSEGNFLIKDMTKATTLQNIFAGKNAVVKDFGFFENGIPFTFTQNESGIIFTKSSTSLLKILNQDILDIQVIEQTIDAFFCKIKISLNESEIMATLPATSVKELIYSTFIYKKAPLLPNTRPQQLFASWTRQVNDYVLYHYLGQFFAIKAEIEEIQKEYISKELKEMKLVNLLYYGLQSQKKILDTVSVYIPAMLGNEQQELFHALGNPYDESQYRNLQRQLMGVNSQLNRHINEIQSSLNAISFAIVPRKTMDDFIKERAIRNGLTAAAISILSLPSGIFMGLNSIFSTIDLKKQEEIKKENEQYRIEFYLDKALDAFDHFMDIMVPFYIAETNQKIFESFQLIAKQYQPIIESAKVKESLLKRLGEIHTFKQLPIDSTVVKRKSELIGEIHGSTENAFQSIINYRNEVHLDVQKSIPLG